MKPINEQRRQELIALANVELTEWDLNSDHYSLIEIALDSLNAMQHKWSNGCDDSVPRALRYLAENDRPGGGNSSFNTEHLYQLAIEIEQSMSRTLYTAPPVPVIKFPDDIDWNDAFKLLDIRVCGEDRIRAFMMGANWRMEEIKRLNGIK